VAAPTFTLFFQFCYSSVIRFNIEEQSNNNTIAIEYLISIKRRNSEANPCLLLCCRIANIETFGGKFKKTSENKAKRLHIYGSLISHSKSSMLSLS
ncbi:MAG: hypothetical protein II670_04460, partial [Alphaproteobacteria bacterium]|nr:hypothetical protein [Alphaproteobacteria bacterium]